MTPDAANPGKYAATLDKMQPGEPELAYEDGEGFVALGRLSGPKEQPASRDDVDRLLYPDTNELVSSMAIAWDTSVRRSSRQLAEAGIVMAGRAIRSYSRPTKLRAYLAGILEDAFAPRAGDPDVWEAAMLERVRANPALDTRTRAAGLPAPQGAGRHPKGTGGDADGNELGHID